MPCIAFLKAGHSVQDAGVTNAMSALGQKRTFRWVVVMSALPPKADIGHARRGGNRASAAISESRRAIWRPSVNWVRCPTGASAGENGSARVERGNKNPRRLRLGFFLW
jgi:hypothetical protein